MQPLQEKLWQCVTKESLVSFRLNECLARDIVVTRYKRYCSRDINASPHSVPNLRNYREALFQYARMGSKWK